MHLHCVGTLTFLEAGAFLNFLALIYRLLVCKATSCPVFFFKGDIFDQAFGPPNDGFDDRQVILDNRTIHNLFNLFNYEGDIL